MNNCWILLWGNAIFCYHNSVVFSIETLLVDMFTAMYVEYQYSLHKCRSCCRAPTTFNWLSSELACTFFVLSHSLAEFVCEQLVCLGDTFGDTFHDNFDKSTLTGVIDGRIVSTSWRQTKPSLLSDTPSRRSTGETFLETRELISTSATSQAHSSWSSSSSSAWNVFRFAGISMNWMPGQMDFQSENSIQKMPSLSVSCSKAAATSGCSSHSSLPSDHRPFHSVLPQGFLMQIILNSPTWTQRSTL